MNTSPSQGVGFDCSCVTLESLRCAIPLETRNRTPRTVETQILRRALSEAVHTGFVWPHVAPAGEPTTYHAPELVWARLIKGLISEFQNHQAWWEARIAGVTN